MRTSSPTSLQLSHHPCCTGDPCPGQRASSEAAHLGYRTGKGCLTWEGRDNCLGSGPVHQQQGHTDVCGIERSDAPPGPLGRVSCKVGSVGRQDLGWQWGVVLDLEPPGRGKGGYILVEGQSDRFRAVGMCVCVCVCREHGPKGEGHQEEEEGLICREDAIAPV